MHGIHRLGEAAVARFNEYCMTSALAFEIQGQCRNVCDIMYHLLCQSVLHWLFALKRKVGLCRAVIGSKEVSEAYWAWRSLHVSEAQGSLMPPHFILLW